MHHLSNIEYPCKLRPQDPNNLNRTGMKHIVVAGLMFWVNGSLKQVYNWNGGNFEEWDLQLIKNNHPKLLLLSACLWDGPVHEFFMNPSWWIMLVFLNIFYFRSYISIKTTLELTQVWIISPWQIASELLYLALLRVWDKC